jgi:hypothetical protein
VPRPKRGLHLDREQMLRARVEKEEIDSVQARARQVPHGVPAVADEHALHDRLGDVARGPGETAAALFRAESSQRLGAGAGEAAIALRLEVEAAEDEITVEGDRLCRPQCFRKRRASHRA